MVRQWVCSSSMACSRIGSTRLVREPIDCGTCLQSCMRHQAHGVSILEMCCPTRASSWSAAGPMVWVGLPWSLEQASFQTTTTHYLVGNGSTAVAFSEYRDGVHGMRSLRIHTPSFFIELLGSCVVLVDLAQLVPIKGTVTRFGSTSNFPRVLPTCRPIKWR